MLSIGMQKTGNYKQWVVMPPFPETIENDNQYRANGIDVVYMQLKSNKHFLNNLLNLRLLIKRHKIEIIHSHLRNADFYVALLSQLCSVPAISTLHGPTRNLLAPETIGDHAKKSLHSFVLRHYFTRIIAISHFVKELNIKDLRLDPDKIDVVYNSTDCSRFDITLDVSRYRQKELGIPYQSKIVAIVGELTPRKGVLDFVEIASQVNNVCDYAWFLVVGDGPLLGEMRLRVEANGLTQRFMFLGLRLDIPEIMQSIDILVVTSHKEGFGRTITEAMCAGKPVVAYASGGPSEIILHGSTGFLVPHGDIVGMKTSLIGLLNDEQKRREFGKKGRARVENNFSLDELIYKTMRVVDSALQSKQ